VRPSQENRWRLAPTTVEAGFEAWPSLEELFPVSFQGVNHNRGLEGGVIDTDRAVLEERLRGYFAAKNFAGREEGVGRDCNATCEIRSSKSLGEAEDGRAFPKGRTHAVSHLSL
jgi:hypothetical protein